MEQNNTFSFCVRNSNESKLNKNLEKKTENENNKNEEHKNKNIHMNNTSNTPVFVTYNYKKESKKDCNTCFYNNDKNTNIYNLYSNDFFQNESTNKYNNKFFVSNEILVNEGELIQVNSDNYIEQNDFNKTNNTSNKTFLNGKQITTKNEAVSDVLNNMFHKTEINMNTIKDMQLTKKKKKRRTKSEVDNEKKIKSKEIKTKLKLGRKGKNEIREEPCAHSKKSDDNIIKKINSFFLESVRNWLNNSFIDENGNFETLKERQKNKKPLFLKIEPKLFTTNLKKAAVIKFMDDIFKNIFSNNISKKYTNPGIDDNQQLINELYNNKNQPFVLYILESKFIDIFNIFNGEKNGENIKQYFLEKNIDEQKINIFLNNFDNIGQFLTKIKIKMEKENINESNENIEDYIERIAVLCLNYKTYFENKYHRSENKNKKEIKKEYDINI